MEARAGILAETPSPALECENGDTLPQTFLTTNRRLVGPGERLLHSEEPGPGENHGGRVGYFDGERYELFSYVVMPNHVHVLFRPLGSHRIPKIVKSWKGFTALQINRRTGKSGTLWQEDYWDRLIRNPRHFWTCWEYIRLNPAKARLSGGEFVLFEKRRGDF